MIIDPRKLIIRKPGAQTLEGKIAAWLLAIGFLWWLTYVTRVFLAAIGWGTAWWFSSSIAGHMSITDVLHNSILIYLPAILVVMFLLWGWAFYNWLRFRGGRNKRCVPSPSLSLEEECKRFSLPPSLLQEAKQAKVDICHFDDRGAITAIDCYASVGEAEKMLYQEVPVLVDQK